MHIVLQKQPHCVDIMMTSYFQGFFLIIPRTEFDFFTAVNLVDIFY